MPKLSRVKRGESGRDDPRAQLSRRGPPKESRGEISRRSPSISARGSAFRALRAAPWTPEGLTICILDKDGGLRAPTLLNMLSTYFLRAAGLPSGGTYSLIERDDSRPARIYFAAGPPALRGDWPERPGTPTAGRRIDEIVKVAVNGM